MKKAKKVLLLLLCAILLVCATVAGTVAYLTSAKTVTNTFTVGKVEIDLNETDVDNDNSTKANTYHLLPGIPQTKDPTVTVLAGSEDCYVRMKVTVNAPKYTDDDFETWAAGFITNYLSGDNHAGIDTTKWTAADPVVDVDAKTATYIINYNTIVTKPTANSQEDGENEQTPANTVLTAPFKVIKAPSELGNTDLAKLDGMTITVEAHAIQANGFTDAADAWSKFTTN